MHLNTQLLWLVLALLTAMCDCARILAVFPYNARSHWIVTSPLLQELHHRGHHLTVVSSFNQKTPLKNYRVIDLSQKLPVTVSNYTFKTIKDVMPNLFRTIPFIAEIHLEACEVALRKPEVINLLNEQFDLVITEIFGSDCGNYFAHHLKTPLISWVTTVSSPWMSERTGLPEEPSYIPNFFMDYSGNMNFIQRLYNTLTLAYAKAAYYYFSEIPTRKMAEEAFGKALPPVDEVNKRTSLVLLNSHFSLGQSRPITPNVIEVGGIHVQEPQPLPKDLKDLLDNSKQGVVLFSMGSLVRASSLPTSKLRMFLDVFATLPQLFVIKYEDSLEDVPPNVIVRKWLPQKDIVAHPNVQAVITHGGLASVMEAVHFAKPLIGVPFFSDQFFNVKNIVHRGAGFTLDLDHLTPMDISEALRGVLQDPRYMENMQRLSAQFRDRPLSALQSAVFWTEYVIRHQGAPHLQPASVHQPLYQYLLLDVLTVLLAAASAVFICIYFLLRLTCSFICGAKNKSIATTNIKHKKYKKNN